MNRLDFLEKIVIENIRKVMYGVRGMQRRASPPANQLTADIKQLPRGGRHSYFITKEQGLCFVHYLCNRPPSSIGNLFIQCRCRFNPMSFSQALVLLSSFKFLLDISVPRLKPCLLYTSPSPRDEAASRMPSSA